MYIHMELRLPPSNTTATTHGAIYKRNLSKNKWNIESSVTLATFQELASCRWLVAVTLHSVEVEHFITAEGSVGRRCFRQFLTHCYTLPKCELLERAPEPGTGLDAE